MMRSGERAGRRGGGELTRVLERNIEALVERRRSAERTQRRSERLAEGIGRFAGSMTFVWVHLALVAFWVAANVGVIPGVPRFDADFVKLATAASVEAIFLTTFVLVMQNRMQALADKRADLDLQVSLLAEHEVTRLIRLVDAIARRLGVDEERGPELGDLKRDVQPDEVLDRIEAAEEDRGTPGPV